MHTRDRSREAAKDIEPERPRMSAARRLIALVIGTIVISGSFLIAWEHIRANSDAQRSASERALTDIGGLLQFSLQREQDLAVTARWFFANNPSATSADVSAWASTTDIHNRYPEVLAIQLVGYATDNPSSCSLQATAAFDGRVAELPAGVDLCSNELGGSALHARDSGRSSFASTQLFGQAALIIQIPRYTETEVPPTVVERRAAFVGTVGILVGPELLMARARAADPDRPVALAYHDETTQLTFPSPRSSDRPMNLSVSLGDGWSAMTIDGADGGVQLGDRTFQLVVLACSLVGALCALVLATGRPRRGTVTAQTDEPDDQVLHDDLTGLCNRAAVLERVEQLLCRSRRHDTLAAALFIDLDGFKSVNATFGHRVGDELLRAAAQRLLTVYRLADTVGRMGGDQFVVLLEGEPSSNWPERAAQRVLDIMRHPFPIEINGTSRPLFITASVGLSMGNRLSGSALLRDADLAMCRAKDDGSDCYQVFQPHMHQTMRHRLALEVDLHTALDRGEFELHYQPIYDVNDLAVVGVEALLRWNHPMLGLVQPDDFIPTLERTGQIVEVGRWVLTQACRQAAQWHAAGRAVGMSVNVSARQLDHAFAADIRHALASSNLMPAALTIELTESVLMRDPTRTAQVLRTIKSLGVHVAIDDFGTGFSSLAYIQQFPVDSLKIDRTFTQAIGTSPESDALLRTVVQLATDLGLQTVAEGVETIAQLDGLRDLHINHAQGYLLARPLDAQTVTDNILQASSNLRIDENHPNG